MSKIKTCEEVRVLEDLPHYHPRSYSRKKKALKKKDPKFKVEFCNNTVMITDDGVEIKFKPFVITAKGSLLARSTHADILLGGMMYADNNGKPPIVVAPGIY